MLNGKLKSHFELWDALLQVEKMFDTMNDEVSIMPKYSIVCVQHATAQPHVQHLQSLRVYGHCLTVNLLAASFSV